MIERQYLSTYLISALNKLCNAVFLTSIELIVITNNSIQCRNFTYFLINDFNLRYSMLFDAWGIDYLNCFKSVRFELNYHLRSLLHLNSDIRFSLALKKTKYNSIYSVISISNIFSSAVWLEREIWDLYGIFFPGNQDLRRILTDYGFSGYPFRKDFPLSGYLELRYEETESSIITNPISLDQNFRNLHGNKCSWLTRGWPSRFIIAIYMTLYYY